MSNDTLREELEREFERLIWEKFRSKGLESYTQAKLVALDLLATNRAQAEEIEKLKQQREWGFAEYEAYMRPSVAELEAKLATVTQERDARTQEAAAAQARLMVLERALEPIAAGLTFMRQSDYQNARVALSTHSPTAALDTIRAQDQARVKDLEEALEKSPVHGYGCEESDYAEKCDYCSWFAVRKAALAESSPTAALEAVVQRARREVADKLWEFYDQRTPEGTYPLHEHDERRTKRHFYEAAELGIGVSGLREGEKP